MGAMHVSYEYKPGRFSSRFGFFPQVLQSVHEHIADKTENV